MAGHASSIVLKLYISGTTTASVAAIDNVRRLRGRLGAVNLTVVDVTRDPGHALPGEPTPMLVKEAPGGERRVDGDFSDVDTVLRKLGLARTPLRTA